MKKHIACAAILLMAGCTAGSQHAANQKKGVSLGSESEKFSYAIGLDIGHSLKRIGTKIDLDAFDAAVATVMLDRKPALTAQDAARAKKIVFKKQQEKFLSRRKAQAVKNRKEGDAFLAGNAKKPGVQVTASGLQYQVLKAGSGPKPKATDRVKVNYKGTLIDGTEFDSSYKRGKPVTFPLNRVIRGWTEGLQLMPVGSKYRFFLPSQLAYGEQGAGSRIGPDSTLVFDIELLSIEGRK